MTNKHKSPAFPLCQALGCRSLYAKLREVLAILDILAVILIVMTILPILAVLVILAAVFRG